jgi:pantoate--beta-alanine ligase
MLLFKDTRKFVDFIKEKRHQNQKIGFVPTMGALHEGHLSLIRQSGKENDLTVCSIFVNPTQFNNAEDLARYPRPVEQDINLLSDSPCSVLLLPSVEDMYPRGMQSEALDIGHLETILEGRYRPGHFQGVVQIVSKFLEIIRPDNLYLGQKDYQQCNVLMQLVKIKQEPVAVHICPTLREPDGLAMSSRNLRLTESQRAVAGLIYQCLISIQAQKNKKDFAVVHKECEELLHRKGFVTDYIEIADADTLELLNDYLPERPMVALIAASLGPVRLIDNLIL